MSINKNQVIINDQVIKEAWRSYLTTGVVKGIGQPWFELPVFRSFYRALPAEPRCQICYIPFAGFGGSIMRNVLGVKPSQLNPHMCNMCELFAEKFLGGVELEVSILFTDVRGSTPLAEQMGPAEFSDLIHRYYHAALKPLFSNGAFIEKFVGDGMTAFFTPAFAGPNHAKSAIEAGKAILRATGNAKGQTPWIPVGVGVNTGTAYIGSMRMEGGRTDITVLGDTVNTTARLCSQAAAGELLVSRSAQNASGLLLDEFELRRLTLKGKQEAVEAWVVHN